MGGSRPDSRRCGKVLRIKNRNQERRGLSNLSDSDARKHPTRRESVLVDTVESEKEPKVPIPTSASAQANAHMPGRESGPHTPAEPDQMQRDQWVSICTVRLKQLRPHHHHAALTSVARSLWLDVGSFDPLIAAELESESWPLDH